MMGTSLIDVRSVTDILLSYQKGPVGELLAYQNLLKPYKTHTRPRLLIGTCMDHRLDLNIPAEFACILRVAGGNLRRVEFDVSYAIAVRGIRAIAVIGHDQCGMADLASQRSDFVDGLSANAGWSPKAAEEHFSDSLVTHDIGTVMGFLRIESQRLGARYPGVQIAPLFYNLEEHLLYQVAEAS